VELTAQTVGVWRGKCHVISVRHPSSAERAPLFRRAAEYGDKILRVAQPGELPVEQSSQYMLVVNLKTAKALGNTISQSILLHADGVIR
jgi:putative tryptophan/tyrosine transport system substrate-binding protein